ncbi:MAG: ferritin-like domain-containing protein [Streptosporangiaceae bacterium]
MNASKGTRTRLTRAGLGALQAALAAEQAAAYGYGVVGSHLTGPQAESALAAYVTHQSGADRLDELLAAARAVGVPARVAYQLPHPVSTPGEAVALAVILEEQVTSAYLGLVARGDRDLRVLGARQARAAALRAARWRGSTVAFPGLPDDARR